MQGRDFLNRKWRRSLQFRTVTAAVLLTAFAFLGVGAFLSSQIASGLYQERVNQAEAESRRGLSQVKTIFESSSASDRATVASMVGDTLKLLEGTGAEAPRYYLLTPLPGGQNLYVFSQSNTSITANIIPEGLAKEVATGSGQYRQALALPVGDSDVPAIGFGTQVQLPPGNAYALYLVYDLSSVQQTLDFIHRVLWIGGALLLVLVGGIVWLLTRAVVHPVSQAAIVSEKLAAGQLQERLEVRGEDELARLGASFNHMAGSLQEQITQLATLSEMQQRFVSDVSHELRTPLTTVRMAAEVLYESREDFDPINARSTELLYNQVERFQALLADLLEISRFDAGAAALDAEPTDLVEIARTALDAAQPLADNSGAELRLIALEPRCIADMDRRRIERILRNLIVNALEHGDGNPVELTVGATEEAVAVAVRDYGIGMTPMEASRVFDRFWRADPARARTTGGSGLGLSISTEDARLHGGWLQAWGEPGNGACFRLTLPRHSGGTLTHSPLPLPPAGANGMHRHPAAENVLLEQQEENGVPDPS
ncbi:MtrAB system histidine kinase MtrB [Arthrobacter sulfonylureivorans]|uniref:Sensor histidine kinase MtrB n=1 Tax=Arthrobacter sulfonylureivorans TaxID=2486855 RepID=A0ABY3WGZ1_9MICC|nr:MtrAB system histidine kinase MtrB [Arthrobacter sulfonylureivorans]UNK47567.1 MtrAB system histidine kinase MtrB [Arthrobacter sulfonylureivorans]